MTPAPLDPARLASAAHSRWVQRVRRRYGLELPLLAPGLPDASSMIAVIDQLCAGGRALPSALRVARQLVLERLAVLDIEQQAPLQAITGAMTTLAEVSLNRALAQARREQDAISGAPLDAQGRDIDLWIVGMGKLGARELNVSSDIDLIYVYEADGVTAGERSISAHEYFSRVVKRLYALIGETTDDGFVFRVDLALRPNGNSGPAVVSLGMLEEYFQVQGREWERFAWLKSRVLAPKSSVAAGRALPLRALVTAFVYRRYLDYGVFEGLRQLHRKIRDEAQRRAAGRPERANDVKLSRGGIREIEFIVQLLQVVRGGQFPEIRTRSTLSGLQRLAAHGLMSAEVAARLADAYRFLRRLEHRIQFLDDQQTHLVPTDDGDLAWIAGTMALGGHTESMALGGHTGSTALCGRAETGALIDQLGQVREFVAAEFDALLHDGAAPAAANGRAPCTPCGGAPLPLDSEAVLARLPEAIAERVRAWCAQPRWQALHDDSKLRLGRLIERAVACVAAAQCGPDSVLRLIDWLDPLLRRGNYLALLAERPEVLQRLLRLLGLARWPMRYLMRHPGVIDELADPRLLQARFVADDYRQLLDQRHSALLRSGQADDEALMDTLRNAHHAEVFRTLVRDVEGLISVEQVADELSALADATLESALRWAWPRLKQRHRESPQLAVIAYGKLGGKELGYGSDLDVVFVYDDGDEADVDRAQEVYGHFVRKLITWLTLRTTAGELFDIDTALRPNGNSGLLVTSIASFERYQIGRGSNTAWTWEHQALTRARFCAGAPELADGFNAVRRQVLAAAREADPLRAEVLAMRDKLRRARPVREGLFDLKYSAGGMVDVEFAVQYLVLAYSPHHAELLDNVGNIALLQRAQALGLLQPGVGTAAADAYRELRHLQHRARLDEQPTLLDAAPLASLRDSVLALWAEVFGAAVFGAAVPPG